MEACFNLFGDTVSLGARLVHGLCIMHPMIILSEEAQVEGRFDLFGDSANLDPK